MILPSIPYGLLIFLRLVKIFEKFLKINNNLINKRLIGKVVDLMSKVRVQGTR